MKQVDLEAAQCNYLISLLEVRKHEIITEMKSSANTPEKMIQLSELLILNNSSQTRLVGGRDRYC